ncbi:MAG: hypothetical protein ACI9Z4_000520 [Polaribacter sp.]|jgi:hypothetical protein
MLIQRHINIKILINYKMNTVLLFIQQIVS